MKSTSFSFILFILLSFSVSTFAQNKAKVKSINGLSTIEFETPKGKITVHLPENPHAGDVISGTVIAEPKGKNKKQKQKNKNILNGYVIEIEKGKNEKDGKIKWKLPEDTENTFKLILKDPEKTIGKIELPMSLINHQDELPSLLPGGFSVPSYMVKGQYINITGAFDGDYQNSILKIDNSLIPIIAESTQSMYFLPPELECGQKILKLEESNYKISVPIQLIDYEIGIQKSYLQKGEVTNLKIKIMGLNSLKGVMELYIKRLSSNILIEGQEELYVTIDPKEANLQGILYKELEIRAILNGSFSIATEIIPFIP